MPRMGDSVTEGTILEWHKSEGDRVSADETLVEISTDKVDAEVPAPVERHARAHPRAGGRDRRRRRRARRDRATDERRRAALRMTATQAGRRGPPTQPPAIVDIVTPAAGESVTRGDDPRLDRRGRRPRRAPATPSSRSRPTRSTSSCPHRRAGTITELLAGEGDTVTVGQVIGRMASGGGAAPPAAAEPATARAIAARRGTVRDGRPARRRASPVARRAAAALRRRPRLARRQRARRADRQGRRARRRRACPRLRPRARS